MDRNFPPHIWWEMTALDRWQWVPDGVSDVLIRRNPTAWLSVVACLSWDRDSRICSEMSKQVVFIFFQSMRVLQKRDFKTRKYSEYRPPSEWTIVLWGNDMDREINCTSCWCKTVYWVTYTSLTIHNNFGFGYPVCSECYDKERELRRKYKDL